MINRQKLIEELNKEIAWIKNTCVDDEYHEGRIHGLECAVEFAFCEPPADQWIPCSEPPKESGYYMACIYDSELDNYDFRKTWFAHVDDYDMEESEWRELYDAETVTAWMPLPELNKGVE